MSKCQLYGWQSRIRRHGWDLTMKPAFLLPRPLSWINLAIHYWGKKPHQWECKLVQSLWRTVWTFLKNLKIELSYDPAIPLLGIYPENTILQKDICTHMFIAALFKAPKTWKQPKCPSTNEWIKKMWHIYTVEYYSAIKRSHKKKLSYL